MCNFVISNTNLIHTSLFALLRFTVSTCLGHYLPILRRHYTNAGLVTVVCGCRCGLVSGCGKTTVFPHPEKWKVKCVSSWYCLLWNYYMKCLKRCSHMKWMKLNVDVNWFQTADSGFAILKHCMSILGVLSQSLLLCWLGERHIQQVCAACVDSSVHYVTFRFQQARSPAL
jgi:hypothetical protein